MSDDDRGVMRPSEVLRAARKLVEDGAGAVDAIGYASGFSRGFVVDYSAADVNLATFDAFRRANGIVGLVLDWKDAPERTHAEVLEAFDRAIALAESEGG